MELGTVELRTCHGYPCFQNILHISCTSLTYWLLWIFFRILISSPPIKKNKVKWRKNEAYLCHIEQMQSILEGTQHVLWEAGPESLGLRCVVSVSDTPCPTEQGNDTVVLLWVRGMPFTDHDPSEEARTGLIFVFLWMEHFLNKERIRNIVEVSLPYVFPSL